MKMKYTIKDDIVSMSIDDFNNLDKTLKKVKEDITWMSNERSVLNYCALEYFYDFMEDHEGQKRAARRPPQEEVK